MATVLGGLCPGGGLHLGGLAAANDLTLRRHQFAPVGRPAMYMQTIRGQFERATVANLWPVPERWPPDQALFARFGRVAGGSQPAMRMSANGMGHCPVGF